MGDGSPAHMEAEIMEAVEGLYNDPHPEVKKKARRMMNSYRRTGKWSLNTSCVCVCVCVCVHIVCFIILCKRKCYIPKCVRKMKYLYYTFSCECI